MEEIDIVDENDEIIGKSTKNEAHNKSQIHRVVHGIVKNIEGKIFLVKRAPTRTHGPNLFDASIGGHVQSGESYENAMIREAKEELGIEGKFKFLFKFTPGHPTVKHITSVFIITYNGPICLCEREFSEGNWFNLDEIMNNPEECFTPDYYKTLIRLSKEE